MLIEVTAQVRDTGSGPRRGRRRVHVTRWFLVSLLILGSVSWLTQQLF